MDGVGVEQSAMHLVPDVSPASTSGHTLEEIATLSAFHEAVVLFDTNIVATGLPEQTFQNLRYQELDPLLLQQVRTAYERLTAFVRIPYVRTTSGVVQEVHEGFAIMRERTAFWNRQEERARRRHPRKPYAIPPQKQTIEELNLQELRFEKLIRHGVYAPQEPRLFTAFADFMREIEAVLEVKRDLRSADRQERQTRRCWYDQHADEQLVAMALYLALGEGRAASIITTDMDIPALATRSYALLTGNGNNGRHMRVRLNGCGVRVYFPLQGKKESFRTFFDTTKSGRRQAPYGLAGVPDEKLAALQPAVSGLATTIREYRRQEFRRTG